VTKGSEPLLLPRYVDTNVKSEAEFEAWLSGIGSLLPQRQAGRKRNLY